MSPTNISLLAASLVLQLLLLTLLFTRGMASRVYLFTVLLCFYVVRTVVLLLLFRWISPESYVEIYTGLGSLDVLLQIAIAFEFSRFILSLTERPQLPRALLIPAIFLSSAILAAGIAALLPPHSPAPADRGSIFTGLLFIELLLWSLSVKLSGWQRSVLTGLAGVGAAGMLAQLGKSLAAVQQNAQAYRLWSYFNAVVYLLALVFWIARCKPAPSRRTSEPDLDLPRASRHSIHSVRSSPHPRANPATIDR